MLFLVSCYTTNKRSAQSEFLPVDLVEPLVDAANSRWFFLILLPALLAW